MYPIVPKYIWLLWLWHFNWGKAFDFNLSSQKSQLYINWSWLLWLWNINWDFVLKHISFLFFFFYSGTVYNWGPLSPRTDIPKDGYIKGRVYSCGPLSPRTDIPKDGYINGQNTPPPSPRAQEYGLIWLHAGWPGRLDQQGRGCNQSPWVYFALPHLAQKYCLFVFTSISIKFSYGPSYILSGI